MVASQQVMQQDPQAVACDMSDNMEAFARHGEWDRVEEIAAKLRAAVMQVPEEQRRETILSVSRSIELVQSLADGARADVKEKLSAIRRGKDATAAYGSATGTEKALSEL